jgi:hypothetical protein
MPYLTLPLRPRRVRRGLALIAFGPLLAAPFVGGVARADGVTDYATHVAPAVCATLEDYPTVGGVKGVLAGIMQDTGFGAYDAGRVVGYAVTLACPEHWSELNRFVAVYGGGGSQIA